MTYPGGQSFGDPGSSTRTATVMLNADVSGYSNQLGAAAQQTNQLSASVSTLTTKMSGLDKWVGRKLFHFAAGDFAILASATADAATFEKQLSTLSATAAVTGRNMGGLKSGIETTFTSFPAARGEVIALTEAVSNLGVTGEKQINSLTRTFLKLGAATGENSVGLATGLTQFSRMMGVSDAGQIGNMANSLLTVSKNAGVSATGVLSFAQAIGPMARQANIGWASVMGISGAFQKAGQDGYYAANSFNSMLSDITQLSSTGSPDLAKYANLLGVTVDQFKRMDKGTAFTDIVEKLGKMGPGAVAVLDQLGQDGVRTQRTFAALAQSGDLRTQVETALGAQGNQHNLNKGASAAFNNLADSLSRLRNQFTELGSVIGATFLKPMQQVVSLASSATNAIGHVIRPAAGVIGGTAALAGGAAVAGGAAMSLAGLIGTVALVKTITNGSWGTAMKAGSAFERTGISESKILRPFQERGMAGQLPFFQQWMYNTGAGVGRLMGRPGEGGGLMPLRPGVLRNLMITAPGRLLDVFNAGNRQFLDQSTIADPAERARLRATYPQMSMRERFNRWTAEVQGKSAADAFGGQVSRSVGLAGGAAGAYTRAGFSFAAPVVRTAARIAGPTLLSQLVGGFVGSAFGLPHAGTYLNSMRQMAGRGERPENIAAARQQFMTGARGFGRELSMLARGPSVSFKELALSAKTAAAGLKNMALQGTGALLGTTARMGYRTVATTLGIGADIARSASRMLMSPMGMIGLVAGGYAMHRFNNAANAGDVDKFLNPIQKYNDLLGTTTANLANFNNALASGANQLGQVAGTIASTATVTSTDISTAPNKPANAVFGDIANNSIGDRDTIRNLAAGLGAMPISDPKQLQAAKLDMLSVVKDPAIVQRVLDLYMKMGGPNPASGIRMNMDWSALGYAAVNTEGRHAGGAGSAVVNAVNADISKSTSGGHILATMISGIDSQRLSDAQQYGGGYAQQRALRGYAVGLSPLVGAIHGSGDQAVATSKALANTLAKVTGGDEGTIRDFLLKHQNDRSRSSERGREQTVVDALGSTTEGKRWLARLTAVGGSRNVGEFNTKLVDLSNTSDGSSFNGLLRRYGGGLGRFAANSGTVQSAIGVAQSTPGTVDKSIGLLLDKSVKLGGGFEGAAGALSKLQGAIGDSTSALYKQATAAQQLAIQEAGFRQPFQTRGQNFRQAITGYQAASTAYYGTPEGKRTDEQYNFMQSQKAGYEQSLGEQQQYLQSMYQTAQSYGLQMKRAAEDENTQIFRARRKFRIQMQQAEFDFNRQELRAEKDHATQLANQAEQTAQSIYDPYTRVQAKYTASADTTLQNLQDQNARIAKQTAEVRKLHKMGVSTQAIQTLDLANPENAQQVDRLLQNIQDDPNLAKKINKQIVERLKNTKVLTQNPFVLSFEQGEAEFHRQLTRAQTDYETATHRAQQQQGIALGDMATDYGRTVNRAGEDLNLAMTEVTGNFGAMYDKTMGQIAKSVEKFSPKAAAQMRKDLSSLTQQFPFLMYGDATKFSGMTISTPETVGVNPQGKVGYYDAKGKFYEVHASNINTATLPQIKPPPKPKPKPAPRPPTGGPARKIAEGGITIGPTMAMVSEWSNTAAEAHIPLNRGASYFQPLAESVSRAMLQQLHTAGHGAMAQAGGGSYHYSDDHSTKITGDIDVYAADLKDLLRQLSAKQRLSRLASPTRRDR